YSSAGQCLWAQRFGSTSTGGYTGDETGLALATAGNGDVIVGGSYSGAISFGSTTLTAPGTKNGFVAKLSGANGSAQWARSTGMGLCKDVAVDGSNNVIITGGFSGTVNFGAATLASVGNTHIFLAKYTSTGTGLWAMQF